MEILLEFVYDLAERADKFTWPKRRRAQTLPTVIHQWQPPAAIFHWLTIKNTAT
jgi:hypothetical protein